MLALAMSRCHGCLELERLALLQIKASINLPNGTFLQEWRDDNTTDCCDWPGVECQKATRSIITLELFTTRILGDWCLNVSLFRPFESLTDLNLGYNQLVICTDNEGVENQLSKMRNLEVLDLRSNKLDNSVLSSISGLASLKSLYLGSNSLKGSIDLKGLCGLKTLQVLDLSDNELEGNLPWCWENLTSLKSIDLYSNQLTGDIALSPLVNLTSLEDLQLSNNSFQIPISFRPFFNHSRLKVIECLQNYYLLERDEFQASVPSFQLDYILLSNAGRQANNNAAVPKFLYHQHSLTSIELQDISFGGKSFLWLIENNTELGDLTLRNNSFTGPLQMPSNPVPKLTYLDISSNHFSGNIPEDIATSFPGMEYLTMSRNSFTGTIPSSFGDMAFLEYLDLSHNHLSGNIPNSLGMGCRSLHTLRLSNNSLQGSILPARHSLTQLIYLELDFNNFTTISNSLSSCSQLKVLKINHNYLKGPFPTAICQLKSLEYLDISENSIAGILPACFSPQDIGFVKLSKNRLQGPLPHAIFNCTMLRILDLSHNRLTGPIPKWFDNLSSLSILLLNKNHFEGEILSQFCNLSELSLIDLSHNSLSGGIPPCLGNIMFRPLLHNLGLLRSGFFLSYNELYTSQDVMVEELIQTVTKSITLVYRGYLISAIDLSCNNFAGHIPPEIGKLFLLKSLNLSHNSLNGTIPITFADLLGTESLDLSYNRLTGNIPSQLANLDSLQVFNVSFNNLSGPIPQGPHFQTFDAMSYIGNQLLCGKPVARNCTDSESVPVTPRTRKEIEFMDMDTFYVSFTTAYITMLLAVLAILCINPYWRQAWFHLVEVSLRFCYYFVVDNLPQM
ncbi:hypothetical protein RJ639_021053 [Escallonia herrerae]|uniref:Leucine-rich repeat-containing N-terminal plant-type domain-containing protein n=1 Tax=Escallonia herrerae TaxID=1293975 RepID=A0AA88V3G1_9ASTE|nr:hypothetical protein RJ639_021052 [Escallonia herrerae]KAK3000399.1 hypothetical protein RJ639_021053 [Escallonia herrerae]